MKLENLQVYQLSMSLGDRIWDIVVNWDDFAKDTIGKQLVKLNNYICSIGKKSSSHESQLTACETLAIFKP